MSETPTWSERATQQVVRYEALVTLLDEVQATEDLAEIAQAAAVRWKYVTSASAVRLVVRGSRGDFVVLDGARGVGTLTRTGGLQGWDAALWSSVRPTRFSPPFDSPPVGPPPHLTVAGVEEVVGLPVLRGEQRLGSLSMAVRHSRFEDIDLRFAGQLARHLAARVSGLTERSVMTQRLVERATRDPLTGLLNRGAVVDVLEAELGGELPVAVVLADVDRFKDVNDTFGHLVGDDVLREVADALRSAARSGDHVGRFGGEEFLAVLRGCGPAEALDAAERMRAAVRARVDQPAVTISLGVASTGDEPGTADELIGRADRAMYRAKAAGRDRSIGENDQP